MNTPIALVTGASRGLGRSTALHLAARGVDVILTYHSNAAEAQSVVGQIEALGRHAVALPLDVGDSKSFTVFAQTVATSLQQGWQRERFDYLVNNAGVGLYAPFAEATEAQFDTLMNVHLRGPFFLTQKLLPLLSDGGRIVNISSGLTRYLAKELGARGIAVNTLAPGAIETDFGGGRVRDDAQLNAFVASQTALGRVGRPDDIGGAISALLQSDNRWVNAQRIEVSGGQSI